MLVISLAAILEEATASTKNMTGNITDLRHLLEPANLNKLRDFAKVYCFLAFHAKGDPAIVEYLRSGTLPDDSGPDIMVIFTLDEPAPIAVPITERSFQPWAEIDVGRHPAYQMVRALFEGKPVPPLPGLVIFDDLTADARALYVSLADLDTAYDVRKRLRQIFTDVAYATGEAKPGKILNYLSVRLRRHAINHESTESKPINEWLLQSFQVARANYGDIVSTVSLASNFGIVR